MERKPRAPPKAKDTLRQDVFSKPSTRLEEPMPGAYPPVMNLGDVYDLIPVDFEVGLTNYLAGVTDIIARAQQDPSYDTMVYHRAYDEGGREAVGAGLKKALIRASVVGLMQSLVGAHKVMFLSAGDSAAITGPLLPLPIPIRQLASSFGEFEVPALGQKYQLTDYSCVLRRLARVVESLDALEPAQAQLTFLFPAGTDDLSVDWVITEGAQAILARHPNRPLRLPNIRPFSGQIPQLVQDVHAASPYEEADWAALRFAFGLRPADQAGWQVAGYNGLVHAATGLDPTGLPGGHRLFTTQTEMKQFVANAVEAWNRYFELASRWFKMADVAEMGTRAGSVSQTFTIRWDADKSVRAAGLSHPGAKQLALAIVYPTTWLWSERMRASDGDYRVTTTGSQSTLRTQWVSTGLAHRAPVT